MNFWAELRLRLKSETPRFFKKLRSMALYWLGGFAAGYTLLKTETINLPDRYETPITDTITYIVLALVIVTGGTFLPTLNPKILRENAKEDIIEKTKDVIKEKVSDVTTEDIKK